MSRTRRIDRSEILRDIQGIIRTFPPFHIQVTRGQPDWNDFGEEDITSNMSNVYSGEALKKPVSGTVNRYGLGQVENQVYTILIAGRRDIRQGDFAKVDGVLFQVQHAPSYFGAYMVLDMEQYSQIKP